MRKFSAPEGYSGFSIGGQQYNVVSGVLEVEDDCSQLDVLWSLGCREIVEAAVLVPDSATQATVKKVVLPVPDVVLPVPDVVVPALDKA